MQAKGGGIKIPRDIRGGARGECNSKPGDIQQLNIYFHRCLSFSRWSGLVNCPKQGLVPLVLQVLPPPLQLVIIAMHHIPWGPSDMIISRIANKFGWYLLLL